MKKTGGVPPSPSPCRCFPCRARLGALDRHSLSLQGHAVAFRVLFLCGKVSVTTLVGRERSVMRCFLCWTCLGALEVHWPLRTSLISSSGLRHYFLFWTGLDEAFDVCSVSHFPCLLVALLSLPGEAWRSSSPLALSLSVTPCCPALLSVLHLSWRPRSALAATYISCQLIRVAPLFSLLDGA